MYAPAVQLGSALVTIVGVALALVVGLFILKFIVKLAWHIFTLGCLAIVILALAAAVASHFLH